MAEPAFTALFGKPPRERTWADEASARTVWGKCIQQAKKARDNEQRSLLQDSRRHLTSNLRLLAYKASGLLVIAPGTVFAYKDSDAAPRQISAELDVNYVVAGSVQRSGELSWVNVQVIDARDEHVLWAECYGDRRMRFFTFKTALPQRCLPPFG